jgi:hypothetical protein
VSSRRQERSKTATRTSKADQDREVARNSLTWTKRGAILGAAAIIVAILIAVVSWIISHQDTVNQQPPGIAVTTVPHDRANGAPILPVPVVTVRPNAYLPAGVQLNIACLQQVGAHHLLAQISYGQYKDEWIDAFDIKTPENQDVWKVKPPLLLCKT